MLEEHRRTGPMSNGVTLYRATAFFQPFPDARCVFANRVEEHSQFLLPLATLSLSYLSPNWGGDIHFIMPIEPCPGRGVVGERSREYHNYLCRPNWVGYRMIDNRCELACDFRFFH